MPPVESPAADELVAARACEIRLGTGNTASTALLNWLAAEFDDVDGVLAAVLDTLERAATELHTPRGRLALWTAVAAVPDDERRPAEHRHAAKILLAHNVLRVDGDDELHSWGHGEFAATAALVNARDQVAATIVATIDVWVGAHAVAAALALEGVNNGDH